MKRFAILAGLLSVLATGLMANKCGDVSFGEPETDTVEEPVTTPTE